MISNSISNQNPKLTMKLAANKTSSELKNKRRERQREIRAEELGLVTGG